MKKVQNTKLHLDESSSNNTKMYNKEIFQKKIKIVPKTIDSPEKTGIVESFENSSKADELKPIKENKNKSILGKIEEPKNIHKYLSRKTKRDSSNIKDNNNKKRKITLIGLNTSEEESEDISAENNDSIEESENDIEKEENKTIFVNSYFQKINEQDLRNLFRRYGEISHIQIRHNKKCGLIEFNNKSSADRVIKEKNKITLKGKSLKIEYSYLKIKTKDSHEQKESNIEMKSEEKKIEEEDRYTKLENMIKKLNTEVENLKVSFSLMSEINNQNEIQSKISFNYLNKKLKLMANSYKILFIRKLSNLLLDEIYRKYKDKLVKFKIQVGKNKKDIIVVKNNINEINTVDKSQVNQIIDFLRFIWDKSSSIIHINDMDYKFQKEMLANFMKGTKKDSRKKVNINESIELKELMCIIFENEEEEDYKIYDAHGQGTENKLTTYIINKLKEKEDNSIISVDNEKDDNSIFSISDSVNSSEIDFGLNENELKNIIKQELKETNTTTLLNKLIKKIKTNKRISFIKDEIIEINGKFFYNLWKETFNTIKYKSNKNYQKHINKEKISTFLEIRENLLKLLNGIKINLFEDEPKALDKIIKREKIEKEKAKKKHVSK